MLDDTKIAKLRELRASGLTPKEIARSLGVRRPEVDSLIRTAAASATRANESTLVGCWLNRGWSSGLSWEGFPD